MHETGGAAASFPFVVRPASEAETGVDDLLQRIEGRRTGWSDQLLPRGAILFRGFRVQNGEAFAELVSALSEEEDLLEYRGGASPRRKMVSGSRPVYNSTEYPADMELSLHNELSYSDLYPDRIYFFCMTAADEGGETTLGDSRRILNNMSSEVRRRFEEKQICYIRNLPPGRGTGYSWQDAFSCDDRREVERHCEVMGAEYQWLDGEVLRIRQIRPATAIHPATGDEVWFNQADGFHPTALTPETHAELLALCGSEDLFRLNVTYGDGAPICEQDLSEIRRVIRREAIPHRWQAGDLLMLDNLLTAHGRRPFSGERRILVAMS